MCAMPMSNLWVDGSGVADLYGVQRRSFGHICISVLSNHATLYHYCLIFTFTLQSGYPHRRDNIDVCIHRSTEYGNSDIRKFIGGISRNLGLQALASTTSMSARPMRRAHYEHHDPNARHDSAPCHVRRHANVRISSGSRGE